MKRLVLGLAALLLFSGCSANAREPDDLALVRVLGVDGASPVTLTAVCGGVDQQDPARGSCTGESFGLARTQLPWSGSEELALTSVSWLLVGDDADLTAVLFAVLEDQELGASAKVFVADGGAAKVLEGCRDPAADLELLSRRQVSAPTAAKALGTLLTEGSVLLPVVTEREGRLVLGGEVRWNGQ